MSDDLEVPLPVYRVPRARTGLDSGTKRLLLIAGGLGATLLIVLGLSLVGGRHHGVVPVIEAESGPVRVKPEHPGGMSIAGQDDEIPTAAGDQAGKLAPAAEAPSLQGLQAQEHADALRAATAKPPAAPQAAAASTATAAPDAATPAPASSQTAAASASSGPAQTVSLPAQASSVPASAPVSALPEHRPPPAGTHPATPAQSGGHATEVQLGALASEDAAHSEWTRLAKKAPDLLAPHHPAVTRLDRDGHTLWRLRTGGFTDVADATIFCERARAKGLACTIAAF